jgi:uncharacterized membrane protein
MTRFDKRIAGLFDSWRQKTRSPSRRKPGRGRHSLGLEFRSAIYEPLEERIMLDIAGASQPTLVVGRTLSAYDVPDVQNNQETITLTAYNQTADPIDGVLLTDTLKPGVTFASASQLPDQNGQQLAWSLGTIQPFDRASVTLTVSLANPTPTQLDTGASAYGTLDAGMVSWTTAPATLRSTAITANLLASTPDANTTDPFVQEQAAELNYDSVQIFNFLQTQIGYNSYTGSLRGARGTLWSSAGNSLDDASLGVALMRASGIPAQYEEGQLSTAQTQQLILSMFPAGYQTAGYIPAGTATADPANDPKLQSETKDHFWFQFDAGAGMTKADPEFAILTIGQSATTSANNFAEVADNLRYKVEVQYNVEIDSAGSSLFGGGPQATTVIDHTFNSVDLVGRPLTLGNFVKSNSGGFIFTTTTNTYSPYLETGDVAYDLSQDELIEGAEYQEVFTNFPFSSQVLTGAFLHFNISGPDGPAQGYDRTVFDRIGFAARQGLAPPPALNVTATTPPALTNSDLFTISVDSGFVAQAAAGKIGNELLSDQQQISQLQVGANPTPAQSELATRAGVDLTRSMAYDFAFLNSVLAGQEATASLVKAYFDRPNITITSQRVIYDAQTQTDDIELSVDLRRDAIRALAFPGQATISVPTFQTAYGLLDSAIESHVVPPATSPSGSTAVSTADVFAAAVAQSIAVMQIDSSNLSVLDHLDFSAEAKARITQAVEDGKTVFVPMQNVTIGSEQAIAWYEEDPRTGETIGVTEDGGHQALAILAGVTLVAGAIAFSVLGFMGYVKGQVDLKDLARCPNFGPDEQKCIQDVLNRIKTQEPNLISLFEAATVLVTLRLNQATKKTAEPTLAPAVAAPVEPQTASGLLSNPPVTQILVNPNVAFSPPPNQAVVSLPIAASASGGAVQGSAQAASLTVDGQLTASWQTAGGSSAFQAISLSAANATVKDANGNVLGAGAVALAAKLATAVATSGNVSVNVNGSGSLAFYGPAASSLGVSAEWSSYSSTLTGSVTLRLTTDGLTINGQTLPAGSYSITTASATLSGSGLTTSPMFSGSASITATNGAVDLGAASGALTVGGASVSVASGVTLAGYSGTINVAANGNGTDAVGFSGTATNVLTVLPSANSITATQNTAAIFTATIKTSFADSYNLTVNAPADWKVSLDNTGGVSVTPAPGTQGGVYPVEVIAQSSTDADLVAQTTVLVTVTPTAPGMTLAVNADPNLSVPFQGAEIPSAFQAVIHNTGPAADTYHLTFSNLPSGFTVLDSGTSVTVPAGQTAVVGIYLAPSGGQLPAPGTNASFSVTATSQTTAAITQTVNESFSMPAVDAVTLGSIPASVAATPGVGTTTTLTLTNVGNVPETVTLAATAPGTLTVAGLTTQTLAVGQSVNETITFTPAAAAALNSTLATTITATYGPAGNTQTASVEVDLLVRSAQTVAISQSSVDANSAGNTQLGGTLSELSDTIALLQATPTDANLLSRVQLLLKNLNAELSADPALASLAPQLASILADANSGDVAALLAALSAFFNSLDGVLAIEAMQQFTVTVTPGEVDLPALANQQKTFAVQITDTGPDAVSLNLSTAALPSGVTASLGQTQITVQPGATQTVNLTLTSNLVSTKVFTLDVHAAASVVAHDGTAVVAVRAAAADILAVTVNPITVDAGVPVSISASIFNTANASRNVLAHIDIFNAANVVVASPADVPITLSPTASAVTFDLGAIDTSTLISGVYTAMVSLRAGDGSTLPGKTAEAPFLVGLPISASVSASPTTLPPGNSNVTTTITVSNTTTAVHAPVGDIVAFYSADNPYGISNTADGAVFVIENTSAVNITNGVFTITPTNGPADSFKVGLVPAGGRVIVEPGISDDGQIGHTFFKVTGTLVDESESGPNDDDTRFEFTGQQGSTVIDSGAFTPAATRSPSESDPNYILSFLGGPGDHDAPSLDFSPKIVASLFDPPAAPSGNPSNVPTVGPAPPDGSPLIAPAAPSQAAAPAVVPSPPPFNPPAGDSVKWIGAASGNWNVAANWLDTTTNTNHVPDATDNVTIDAAGLTITVNTAAQVAQSLLVKSSTTLAITGGTLTVGSGTEIDGTLTLANATFRAAGGLVNNGSVQWTSATLDLGGADGFNLGTMTLSSNLALAATNGGNTFNLGGKLINEGTIVQQAGSLSVRDSVEIDNTTQGVWQFAGDTAIFPSSFSPTAVNNGVFQKTGGAGNSDIQLPMASVGGTFESDSGDLRLTNADDTFTGGVFNAGAGATVSLNTGAAGMVFSGTFTGSGAGAVLLNGGTTFIGAGGATFNFAPGLFQWVNATINLQGNSLTNTGAMSLGLANAGTSEVMSSRDAALNPLMGTFINQGSLTELGSAALSLFDKVLLSNTATGSLLFAGDGDVVFGGQTPSFTSAGTIEKTSGTDISEIRVNFSYTGGPIKVDSGTLMLDTLGGQFVGTSFTVAAGATLDLSGNTAGNVFTGTLTGTGGGAVILKNGSIVIGQSGVTFDFPTGMFQWTGGGINLDGHTLTNTGSMALANPGNISLFGNDSFTGDNKNNLGGTFNNSGVVTESAAGSLGLFDSVAFKNLAGARLLLASDAGLFLGNFSPMATNTGAIEKTAGSGTSIISAPFSNLGGTLKVDSGTLSLAGPTGQSTGAAIDVAAGATLDLTGNTDGNVYTGTYTGAGAGKVLLRNGDFEIGAAGATFNFPAGMFQWTGGGINLFGHILTNLGVMTLANASNVPLYGNGNFNGGPSTGGNQGGTLDNQGTMNDQGSAAISLFDSVLLKNEAGATVNLSGGASLTYQNFSSAVSNAGKLQVNGSTATIAAPLANSGTIDVTGGATLNFTQNGTLNNTGTLEADGGTVAFSASIKQLSSGALSGGGWVAANGGAIRFPANTNVVSNSAHIVISGPNSTITGLSTLARNDGALTLTLGAALTTAGDFSNVGLLSLGGGPTAGALRPAETTALAFNGSSDFVSVGNIGARPTQGAISFWMKPTTASSNQNVLTTGPTNSNGSGGNRAIRFEEIGQSLYALFGSDTATDNGSSGLSSFLITNSLTPGAWINVAVVWDSSSDTVTGYLNGTQVFSGANANFPSVFGNVAFGLGYGSNPAFQRYYDGLLNDVRLYNVARSQADIQSDMASQLTGNEAGLIGYWPLNDGSGTVAKDLTAGAHNGALGGGAVADEPVWIATDVALGVPGNFTQSASGTLDFQLGGTPASGDFGQLAVSGTATFAGLLHSEFVNGYTPAVGDDFTVATYKSTAGNFGAVELAETPTVAYSANAGATSLALQSQAATLTPTQTTVTSSAPNGASYGQLVEYTTTVNSPSGTPTGSVQFQIDGLNSGARIALSGGQSTLTVALPAGTHTIAAFYISDSTQFANSDNGASPLIEVIKAATVTASSIELYYTTFGGPSSIDKVAVSLNQGVLTLGAPTPIVQGLPADGLIFLPNGDLLTANGIASEVNPETGAVTTENQVSGEHLALDPSGKFVWTSPQPGPLYKLPIDPLGPATQETLTGDDTQVTHLAFDNAGQAFYVSSGGGGDGSFGLIDLTTFTTKRIYNKLPSAHGISYDPFSGDLFLVGANSVTQIDPNTLKIVSELDFPNSGFTLDQGANDGKGHLFAADNGGHLLVVDYSATGLVGDPSNFVATPFLQTDLDDVAPLSGLGGAGIPVSISHQLPATGYNVNPTSIAPNPASFSSTAVTWNTTFTPGQPETDQFQLTGQVTNMAPGEVRQISDGTTVTATVTAQDGTQIPISISLPPVVVAAEHIIELAPPTETVDQGATATYTVELSNPLPTDEVYTLSIDGLSAGETAGLTQSVSVLAGKTVQVPLTVTVPVGATPGTQVFLVSTQTTDGASDSVEGQLTVTSHVVINTLAVHLTLTPAQAVAGQTNPAIYTLTVTNTGDSTDTYNLAAALPSGFTGVFSQTSVTVPPGLGNFRDVRLTLTPPAGATAQDYPFTVTAASTTDNTVQSQSSGTVTVLAAGVRVQLSPSSAVPGSTYQLKVTNTGQATDTFNLSLASPGALVSTLGTNQVTLQAGASQTVPITTGAVNFADQGALPLTGIATSQSNAAVQAQSTANLTIAPTQSMTAAFNPAQQNLTVPGATSFLMQVNNTGNTEDSYSATIIGTSGPVTASLVGLDGQPTQSVPLFILPGLSTGAILLQVNETGTAQGTVTVLVQSLTNSNVKSAPTATITVGGGVVTGPTLSLVKNTGLAVAEGASATIGLNALQATDSDESVRPTGIVYKITTAPVEGSLSLNAQPLAVGGTFTQDDINQGRLAYKAQEEGADSFGFSIAAGETATLSGTFLIASSDPAVVPAGGFTVSAVEGRNSVAQTVATFTDPGGFEPQASYTAEIDWGDGSSSAGDIALPGAGQAATVTGQHTYAEEGSYSLHIKLHHEGAPDATATSAAVVTDAALAASGGFTYSASEGAASAQTVAIFTDPAGPEALADYSAQIDWGDGTSTTVGSISADPVTHVFTVTGQHVYSADGTYPIRVTLHHDSTPDTNVSSTAQIGAVSTSGGGAIAATGVAVTGNEQITLAAVTVATFTAGEGSLPAGDFSASIDWGDGVTSAGSVSLAAGTYTVTGSHKYLDEGHFTIHVSVDQTTNPALSATTSASATMHEELLAEGTLGTADQRYMDEIYRDVFNRQAEAKGREIWLSLLAQGATREAVALTILTRATSQEFQIDTVTALYEQYLHRAPEQAGMDSWVAYLYGGGTIEGMTQALLGSPEYLQVRGGGTSEGFLKAVFQDTLGRSIDAPALTFFEGLMAKGVSAGQVAAAILSSDEYRDVRVEAIYEQLLDRPAKPSELQTYAAELAQGVRDEQIMAELISSDEYFAKAQI